MLILALFFRALLPSGYMLFNTGGSGVALRLCSGSNLSTANQPEQPTDGDPDSPRAPHDGELGLCPHFCGAVRQRERLTDA